MSDVFRPRTTPAREIYDAFQAQAAYRGSRTPEEWIAAERQAVFNAACNWAVENGVEPPTMADVIRAENSACGHVDYGAKWAYGVRDAMRNPTPGSSG